MRKVLVTGAAGFIGKYLIRALINSGRNVIALDRNPCPVEFHSVRNLTWIQSSFIDSHEKPEFITKLVDAGVDVAIHLATTIFPTNSEFKIKSDIEDNVLGSVYFCENLLKNGVSKIIYASSGGLIYGDNHEGIAYNEEQRERPVSTYGVTKLASELYIDALVREYNAKFISLRISNPYGYGQNKINHGVITTFLTNAMYNRPLQVWGALNSTRDYIYIDDLVSAFLASIEYNGPYSHINIGSGKSYSLSQIINIIEGIIGRELLVEHSFDKKIIQNHVKLDVSRATNELNWAPRTEIGIGISKLFNKMVDNNEL